MNENPPEFPRVNVSPSSPPSPARVEAAVRSVHRRRQAKAGAVFTALASVAVIGVLVPVVLHGRSTSDNLQLVTPSSSSSYSPTPSTSRPPASTSPTLVGIDLRHADLKNITVPGAACLQSHPLRLRNGKLRIPDQRGHPDPSGGTAYLNLSEPVWVQQRVTYGHFEAPDVSDAAVTLACDNNGGTADSDLLFSVAVFSGRSGAPRLIGLVTPRQQGPNEPATLIGTAPHGVHMTVGRLTVHEQFYGPHDKTCCMTGRATTVWGDRNGKLFVLSSKITKNAQ